MRTGSAFLRLERVDEYRARVLADRSLEWRADPEIARQLAGDLTRDKELLEMLAEELARYAAARWWASG